MYHFRIIVKFITHTHALYSSPHSILLYHLSIQNIILHIHNIVIYNMSNMNKVNEKGGGGIMKKEKNMSHVSKVNEKTICNENNRK